MTATTNSTGLSPLDRRRLIFESALSYRDKLVLLAVELHLPSEANGECWPTIPTLVVFTSLKERTVKYSIKSLKDDGILLVRTTYDVGKRKSKNHYRIDWSVVQEMHHQMDDSVVQQMHHMVQEMHPHGAPDALSMVHQVHPKMDIINGHSNGGGESPRKSSNLKGGTCAEPLPDCLETDDFKTAWGRWLQHLHENGKRTTATMRTAQLDRLAKDPSIAVAVLEQSITQGWVTLQELKQNSSNSKQRRGYHHNPSRPIKFSANNSLDLEDE